MGKLACPRCGTHVTISEGQRPVCPSCGFDGASGPTGGEGQGPSAWRAEGQPASGTGPAAAPEDGWRAVPPPPPYAGPGRQPPSEGIAIAALLINILLLPGVGTIIGGKTGEGVGQLVLCLVGFVLIIVIVGFFMILGAWIWALVSGIQLLQEARQASVASGQWR